MQMPTRRPGSPARWRSSDASHTEARCSPPPRSVSWHSASMAWPRRCTGASRARVSRPQSPHGSGRMDERLKGRSRRRERVEPADDEGGATARAPLPLHPGARSAARTALAVALVVAAIWTALTFLAALLWAAMLAIALWPLYRKVADRISAGPSGPSALLFTIVIALLVFLPVALPLSHIAQQT